MKKTIKVLGHVLFAILTIYASTLEGFSQKTNNEKESQKIPPKLLQVNQIQKSYSLQHKQQIITDLFDKSTNTSFSLIKQEQDEIGMIHQKHQQYYKGVKIEFGTITLHSKNGMVETISSEFYKIEDLETAPSISNEIALQRAMAHMGASSYLWEDEAASNELDYQKPSGELVVLPIFLDNDTSMKLAYKFEIYSIVPLGGGDMYVDAHTGQALFFNNKVRHANHFGHDGRAMHCEDETVPSTLEIVEELAMVSGTAATRYSGTQTIETTFSGGSYTLNDAGRKVYTRNANNQGPIGNSLPYINNYSEFTDNDNNWTAAEHDNNDKDNAALDAHWGAMMTHDYWNTVHNRDSYDNNGAQLRSYVHVDNNYDNAFWFLNVMSYGDGSSNGNEGNGYFDALTSIDVAAHEIGHAVTEYTANLAYQRESGALNEAYSDIWGAAVEHFAKGNGNDANPDVSIWLIGDEIDRRNGSAALRSMNNPTSLGQPDTYGGSYWINPNCGTPTSNNDYCGVHTNSGVLNYWFYLTVVGGSGTNDIGNAFSVSGIGMTKSAAISYRAINVYLSANSDHADARTAMIQSARDLYGTDGAEEQAVTNAWHAVGVGAAYGGGNPSDCETGDIYLTITFDNYPEETAWTLKDSNGTTVASDSYSTANPDGSTINETFTSLAADNYTFTITDSYGDGICCSYGSGSYTLSSDAGTIVSGGSFGSSEATAFCIEDGGSGPDTEAPTAPTNLTASNITETTADLSWNASSDNVGVTGYNVYSGSTNIGTVTGTGASITGLTANTTYSFTVTAIDAAGNESAASNTETFTTSSGADTQAPTAPTNLTASNVTQTTVELSWNASSDNVGVTGYDVYQGATNVASVSGTSTQISGLTAATSYTFTVYAKDAAGNISSASNAVNVTTQSAGGGSTVLHEGYFESGWDGWADGGADCARYSGSRSYEGTRSIRIRDNTNTSTMTLSNIDVTGYNTVDVEFYFYSYSMENGEDFWLQFNDGSGWTTVASYARGTNFENNNFYTSTVTISSGDFNFSSNAQFRFRNDASGNNDHIYIDQVTITGNSGSGFAGIETNLIAMQTEFAPEEDILEEQEMILSPNPATEYIQVSLLSIPQGATYRIVNLLGQPVAQGILTKGAISVSHLQSGIYFMEVSDGEETMIKRFIKE